MLLVHSLFYAGFFEDPLTWGVLAVSAAVLVSSSRTPAEGVRFAVAKPWAMSASAVTAPTRNDNTLLAH